MPSKAEKESQVSYEEADEALSYGEAQVNQLKANYFKRVTNAPAKRRAKCNHCHTYFANRASLKRHYSKIMKNKPVQEEFTPLSYLPLDEIKAAIYGSKKKKTLEGNFIEESPKQPVETVSLVPMADRSVKLLGPKVITLLVTEVKPKSPEPFFDSNVIETVEIQSIADVSDVNDMKPDSTLSEEPKIPKDPVMPMSCNECNLKFSKSDYLEHLKQVHKRELFLCHECGCQFAHKQSLISHQRCHMPASFQCKVCPAKLSSKSSLRRHMFTHPKFTVKKLICEVCGKRFAYRGALNDHKRSHMEIRPYACRICGRSFKRPSNRRVHEECVHGVNSSAKALTCPVCLKGFHQKTALENHMKQHTGLLKFKCSNCHQSFSTNTGLNVHLSLGRCEKYIRSCAICRRDFKADEAMCEHLEKIPENEQSIGAKGRSRIHKEKKVHCTMCTKKFVYLSEMKMHFQLAHSDLKPFACKLCPKMFKTSNSLAIHNDVHADVKRFECGTCGKQFRRSCNLTIHFRTHTGERPYVCEVCGRRFTQKGDMNKHKLKIHRVG